MRLLRMSGLMLLLAALAPAATLTAQVNSKTPPTFLTINAKPLRVDNATYNFEVTISSFQDSAGNLQLRVLTSITKLADEQNVRFREIRQTISPDATSFQITADGKRFLLEAQYLEPSADTTAAPHLVTTTYGVMFGGGRVGILVSLTN